jgi:hypothetical protein
LQCHNPLEGGAERWLGQSQDQAWNQPPHPALPSIVPLLFLYWCSIGARLFLDCSSIVCLVD